LVSPQRSQEKRTWSKVKSGKIRPKGRHFHSAVVFKGSMYIFGGKNNGYMNDLYCFDLGKHQVHNPPDSFKRKT